MSDIELLQTRAVLTTAETARVLQCSESTVQAITGHSSASVLLDIYAHTDLTRQRDAIERTERRRAG